MGTKKRKYHSAAFKGKVALEAIQERETINQIASRYEVHPNLVSSWKAQLLESLPACFARKGKKANNEEVSVEELYQQIGKLKVQIDWLKKKHESINRGKTHAY